MMRMGIRLLALVALLVGGIGPAPAAPLVDGLGGPVGYGPIADPGDAADISDAFPGGLRLYGGEPRHGVYVNLAAVLSMDGPNCCYIGEPLPRVRNPPPERSGPRIHLFEAAASLTDFDLRAGDWPVYTALLPGDGGEAPGRLIATWHMLPNRPAAIGAQLFVSVQVILTAVGGDGDFDVEFRYERCEWIHPTQQSDRLPVIGFDEGIGPEGRAWMWPGSLSEDAGLLCELSNVREPGVFRFRVRDGLPGGCGIDAQPPPGPGRCADGNHLPGDGCSPACHVEPDVDGDGRYEAPDPTSVDPLGLYDDCVDPDDPACDDDLDDDGVPDITDNCPEIPNPDQHNYDGDRRGDLCDADADGDGLYGPQPPPPDAMFPYADLCPYLMSQGDRDVTPGIPDFAEQLDNDRDGIGDPCDPDDDGDGILDCGADAICPTGDDGYDRDRDSFIDEAGECVTNADNINCIDGTYDLFDNDGDGFVDESDEFEGPGVIWSAPDADGSEDNCRRVANPDQADRDGDHIGDVCDPDRDGDGIEDCAGGLICGPLRDLRDNDADGRVDERGECTGPDGQPACDPAFNRVDDDRDGFIDEDFEAAGALPPPAPVDVCPDLFDPEQRDRDGDGVGDLCADDDRDDVIGADDNCIDVRNPDQLDLDGDGIGDACDPDDDGDGMPDAVDGCPRIADDGADLDGDGLGDVCDPDDDQDGINDPFDVCPRIYDPAQADLDGDGIGDACDPDDDGDGRPDAEDGCPMLADDGADIDGDGLGDACDPDDDGDGIPDDADGCPGVADPAQADLDGDGLGDACDGTDGRPFELRSPAEQCALLIARDAPTAERLAACPAPDGGCRATPGSPLPTPPIAWCLALALWVTGRRRRAGIGGDAGCPGDGEP